MLANTVALPLYMHKICAQLLCNQLLRPHGVPGLFSALFGEDVSVTEAPFEKLDRVAKVLSAPPQNVPRIVRQLFSSYAWHLLYSIIGILLCNHPPYDPPPQSEYGGLYSSSAQTCSSVLFVVDAFIVRSTRHPTPGRFLGFARPFRSSEAAVTIAFPPGPFGS